MKPKLGALRNVFWDKNFSFFEGICLTVLQICRSYVGSPRKLLEVSG
jgi:hypothetical protein